MASIVGLAALSAQPAGATPGVKGTCDLFLNKKPPEYAGPSQIFYEVVVDCALAAPTDVRDSITLWGSDKWEDDRLWTDRPPHHQNDKFLHETFIVHENYLDEDLADEDEIYAIVNFKRPTGGDLRIKTNKVVGWYGQFGI
ncbi:hypothetical protein J5X84_17075 [Streptosporangiaceae bacterium NEAU-GS5]|nr:hypothetical protein [Streptosporangiaceae bacterium NEAU-GS5]